MEYSVRPAHEVKVFDVKAFVEKLKGAPAGMPGMPPGMGGGMMPGMMGMPMSSAPFVPGGLRATPSVSSMDEYLKRLDEQIAKLEAEQKEEERLERERFEAQKKNENDIINIEEENKEDIQKEIEDILDHKSEKPVVNVNITTEEPAKIEEDPITVEEEKEEEPINIEVTHDDDEEPIKVEATPEEIEEPIKVEVAPEEIEKPIKVEVEVKPNKEESAIIPDEPLPHDGEVTLPTYEEVEKPKINIDVDSVVVDHDKKIANDDFFDDFFGGEDE